MFRHNRKSQSMSINVLIVAVLALAVLVILIAIMTGRIKIFTQNLESCAAKQGECKPKYDSIIEVPVPNTDCEKENKVCFLS